MHKFLKSKIRQTKAAFHLCGGNHRCQDLLCQSAGALKTAAEIAARNVRREQVDVALSLSAVVIWCSLGMVASLNALKGLQ